MLAPLTSALSVVLHALTHDPCADRRAEAEAYAARTLQLALAVGLVLALLLAGPCAPWCVGLMGCPVGSPLHPDALAYARTRALALPAALAISASEGIFRGMARLCRSCCSLHNLEPAAPARSVAASIT